MFIAMFVDAEIDATRQSLSLENAGHDVAKLTHWAALQRHLELGPCDALVLSHAAWRACARGRVQQWRDRHPVGVVVLQDGDDPDDRIAALESGADACLNASIAPRELLATLASVVRRLGPRPPPLSQRAAQAGAQHDAWQLLSRNWVLVSPDGKRVQLTATECALLSLLLSQAGKPVSRRDIVTALGHDYRHYDERRLEALVSRLRRKLGRNTAMTPIRVAHGFGYAFTDSALVS
ncbi:winged helix-turn-helix domain-containing protein [Bordetella bronchialis]|uniref:response regulator transcription factor n=1 Tax=Bordetella bronchialis TaxID=463025 RepID=UPI003D0295E5